MVLLANIFGIDQLALTFIIILPKIVTPQRLSVIQTWTKTVFLTLFDIINFSIPCYAVQNLVRQLFAVAVSICEACRTHLMHVVLFIESFLYHFSFNITNIVNFLIFHFILHKWIRILYFIKFASSWTFDLAQKCQVVILGHATIIIF